MKIKGYVSTSELNWYNKANIEKDDNFTPFVLEVWKDKKDFKNNIEKGTHIKEVEIIIK